MKRRMACLSTGTAVIPLINAILASKAPEVDVVHIVDDSIVRDIASCANTITQGVRQRVLAYVLAARAANAELVLVTCSSISEIVDEVRPFVEIPVLKVDEPMARQAVTMGKCIGVIATLATTLGPTTRLLKRLADEMRKEICIKEVLCPGAFEALVQGDPATHDRIVREAIDQVASTVDVVVLAQASMARVTETLKSPPCPVLTSPESGVLAAIRQLGMI